MKTETKNDNIDRYEDEQEELSIISSEELEERLNDLEKSGKMKEHEEEIMAYEKEQEDKAIISYEELLRRASNSVISYESEENLGGIRIGKVDTNKIETHKEENDRPYYKEEEFLKALKEFREAL